MRPDSWNEVLVDSRGFASVNTTISSGGSSLHGTVKGAAEEPGGAPVFLEAWDPTTRKRLMGLRVVHADMQGRYRFDGLPPGSYRVLSTFEYLMPDPQAMDVAGARNIQIEAHADLQVDLAYTTSGSVDHRFMWSAPSDASHSPGYSDTGITPFGVYPMRLPGIT